MDNILLLSPISQPCLLCSSITLVEEHKCTKANDGDIGLERQLVGFFVVTELLHVPNETCCELLTNHGNPDEWMVLCPDCKKLVDEGRKLFQKITQLQKKFKNVQDMVTTKILLKPEPEVEEKFSFSTSIACNTEATEVIRDAVKFQHDLRLLELNELDMDSEVNEIILPSVDSCPVSKQGCETKQKKQKQKNKIKGSPRNENNNLKELEPIHSTEIAIKLDLNDLEDYDDDLNDGVENTVEDEHEMEEVFQNEDPQSSDFEEEVQDSEDSDFEVVPKKKPKKSIPHKTKLTRDPKLRKSKKERKSIPKPRVYKRMSAEERKYPIKEKLTLEQVFALHEKLLKTIPPYSQNMPKKDATKRRKDLQTISMSNLCQRHKVKEFPCSTCTKVFTAFKEWNEHVNITMCNMSVKFTKKEIPVVVERLKCDKCGRKIGTPAVLEEHHRKIHYPPEMFTCRGCSVVFVDSIEYHRHYYDTLKTNPSAQCVTLGIKCPHPECRRVVRNSQETLDIHLKMRHTEKPPDTFKCLECDKSFPSKNNLRRHLSEKHQTAEIPCTFENCTSKFKTQYRLNQHIKLTHLTKLEGAPKFPCKFCKKEFTVKGQLVRHEKLHSSESPHLCTICGKSFKVHNYLTIHMWSHDPEMKKRFTVYKNNAVAKTEMKEKMVLQNDNN